MVLCRRCGEKKEQRAKGLCANCYEYEWRRANPEKAKAIQDRWRQRHPKEARAKSYRWAKRNPEKKKAQKRRWYQRHREEIKARVRHYKRENPHKVAALTARRSAQKRNLPVDLTAEDARRILAVGRCFYCGQNFPRSEFTLDHFLPLSKGGGTTKANIIAACQPCNSSKGTKEPGEFLQQLMLVV